MKKLYGQELVNYYEQVDLTKYNDSLIELSGRELLSEYDVLNSLTESGFMGQQKLYELIDLATKELHARLRDEEIFAKALHKIVGLRDEFEYVDEWVEAEAFTQSEEIARKALENEE